MCFRNEPSRVVVKGRRLFWLNLRPKCGSLNTPNGFSAATINISKLYDFSPQSDWNLAIFLRPLLDCPAVSIFSAEHQFLWSPPAQAGAKNRKSCECVIFGAFMREAVNIDFRHMPSVASQLARGEWKTKFECIEWKEKTLTIRLRAQMNAAAFGVYSSLFTLFNIQFE